MKRPSKKWATIISLALIALLGAVFYLMSYGTSSVAGEELFKKAQKLEEKGLVTRRRSDLDERNLIVTITELGESMKDRFRRISTCTIAGKNLVWTHGRRRKAKCSAWR